MGTLTRYEEKIIGFHTRFGAGAWAWIYQADARMRGEHLERTRRRGIKEHQEATAAGGTHPYDSSRPWEWCFQQAVANTEFWKLEFEDHGLNVSLKAGAATRVLGGGAPLAPGKDPALGLLAPQRPTLTSNDQDAAAGIRALRQAPSAGPPPTKKTQVHNVEGGV